VEEVLSSLSRVGRDYTPFMGLGELREAAAEFSSRIMGRDFGPDRVVVVGSGAHAHLVVAALLSGREALYPRPGFPLYYPQLEMNRVRVRFYDPRAEDVVGEVLRSLSPDTAAVLINYPHNPTGVCPPARVLEELWEELSSRGILLINDFVYHQIYYGERPPPIGEILIDSSSKSLALPGLRVGLLFFSDEETARRAGRLVYHTTAGVSDVSQLVFAAALRAADEVYFERVREHYRRIRDAVVDSLRRAGLEFREPMGAFYVFARHPAVRDASELIARLIEPSRDVCVGLVPGETFLGERECFRVSFGRLTREDADLIGREIEREVGGLGPV